MLTVAFLIAAGLAPTQARQFVDPLKASCALFDISTPPRLAGFIAQCRVESQNFTQLEEGLFYRDAARIADIFKSRVASEADARRLVGNPKLLANTVYANRLGNGDVASGHGWLYRGRGLKHLTALDNYTAAERALGRPYVTQPDLVAQPSDACLTAAWFWHSNGCNALADRLDWDGLTRKVNGPRKLQAKRRKQYSEQILEVFA